VVYQGLPLFVATYKPTQPTLFQSAASGLTSDVCIPIGSGEVLVVGEEMLSKLSFETNLKLVSGSFQGSCITANDTTSQSKMFTDFKSASWTGLPLGAPPMQTGNITCSAGNATIWSVQVQ